MPKKTKKPSVKVDDVAKPGETPASANARPTITGHRPLIKNDPMVAFSPTEDESENDKKATYLKKSKPKITPISDDLKTEKDKPSKKLEEKPKTSETEEFEEKPETKQETTPANASTASESAVIDAIAQTAETKTSGKLDEEEQKRKELVDELAKSGKYGLPILEGGHKGSAERLVSWLFLFMLLVSVGAYLAVDAGYINIGFDLPFEFIKN